MANLLSKITTPDNTQYTLKDGTLTAGTGISISGHNTDTGARTITNTGVRAISTGSTNGTISVNTNGQSTNVSVKGLGTAAYTSKDDYAAANSAVTIAGKKISLGGSLSAADLVTALGLSSAMRYKGSLTELPAATNANTYAAYDAGDVVTISSDGKEYVYNKGANAAGSSWVELGGESAYKKVQKAVNDPGANGTSTSFIKTIEQDTEGVITAQKASLPTASTSAAGIMKVGTGLSASRGTVSVSYGTSANTACQGNDSRLSNARTPTSHTHGNLTNDGKITTTATIANGDKLVIVDSDTTAASKITGSTITFDGSTTTKALTPKGTWESFSKTDEKVKMTAATGNTTVYLLGTTSTPSSTATNVNAVADSGFYISKSNGGTDMLVGPYIGANVVNSLDFQGKGPNLYDLNASTAFGSGTVPTTYLPLGGNGELGIVKVDSTMTATAAGVIGVKYGTDAGTAAEGNHNHDSRYVNVTGDTMTGTLTLKNTSATGGQLSFPSSYDTQAGVALTTSVGGLNIFGIASADGKSRTGTGTTLGINPYTKRITGSYTFEGTATTASKLSNTSAIGDTDHPVYFTNGGVPAQTTYRMAGTNAAATTALAITDNLNTGIWYVNGTNSASLYSQADGVAYVNKYSDSWIHEIYGDYRTGHIAVRGKNNGTWKDWYKVLDSGNYDDFALPLSGGTMTGALNLANNTWNLVGDDAYIGDINKAGHVGIQGKNGNTGLFFTTYNQTSKTTGAALTWNGAHLVSDKGIEVPTLNVDTHICLERTGGHSAPNYINVPAASALAFTVGTTDGAHIAAMIEDHKVIPYTTNTTDMGNSTYQWKSMHSQTAVIDQHVTLQYNSTDASLDFVFA